jgi:hypothetical protein
MTRKKTICIRLRRAWRNFWSVTPDEWVRVQIFCATIAGSIGVAWEKILGVFGDDADGTVKAIMVTILALSAFMAAYAQAKVKTKKK